MNARTFIIFSIVPLAVGLWVSQTISGQINANAQQAMYADLIDQVIACCDAKSTLRSSRSEKLRQAAAIACLKSAYLKNYREQIIEEMVIRHIRPSRARVQ